MTRPTGSTGDRHDQAEPSRRDRRWKMIGGAAMTGLLVALVWCIPVMGVIRADMGGGPYDLATRLGIGDTTYLLIGVGLGTVAFVVTLVLFVRRGLPAAFLEPPMTREEAADFRARIWLRALAGFVCVFLVFWLFLQQAPWPLLILVILAAAAAQVWFWRWTRRL
jgi:hypothetical protein